MRSTIIASAIFAAGALALPALDKRAVIVETAVDVVTKVVVVQVTGPSPTAVPTPTSVAVKHNNVQQAAVVTPAPAPAPAPSTTADPVESSAPAPSPAAAAPSPASSPASSGASGSFEEMVVSSHNTLRAAHQAGELQYDEDLAASAMALAQTCKFEHDVTKGPASNYGQNIAMSWGTASMHDAQTEMYNVISDSWYSGEAQTFGSLGLYGVANPIPNDFDAWGHFTQEVWKGTTHVGCAAYLCSSQNGYFTVCNYSPPGNFAGEFASNVLN